MYVSPIEIVYKQMQDQMNLELENGVIKAVNSVGINIDKQELMEALRQDRRRYEAAYQKGYNDCMSIYEERIQRAREALRGEEEDEQ